MKKILRFALMGLLVSTFACKDDDPDPIDAGETELVLLSGNLTTQTLDATKQYLIQGQTFVQDGQVLTVPAGTVIYGERRSKGTLIINEGGRIVAEGTADNPIVFTSNQAEGERDRGDWGGVIILGKANVNQNRPAIEGISPEARYGTQGSTTNDGDNSGVLRYVRIEFAGIELTPNNETNSLTLGAVGNGTVIENVQVSYGGDDGFEWFGGTVNCKNLISYSTWDDDFDVDFGYSGNVQFGLAVRNPSYADQSGSNGFEVDNDATGSAAIPLTSAVFSNMTILGPRVNTGSSLNANYQNALHIRRNAAISIFNSVISGFPTGLRMDGANTITNYTAGSGILANNTLIAIGSRSAAATPFATDQAAIGTAGIEAAWAASGNELVLNTPPADNNAAATKPDYAANNINEQWFFSSFALGEYPANPGFTMTSVKSADFTNPKISGAFFDKVAYRGAIGTTDWTDGWSDFNPVNAQYAQ
ncbi:hypothetical protein Q0590_15010 [Rhodocytophaga aerolata]|uniref:T9SS C-terminal target domain-containing protein n=1 Tax=Rhodocytophaga aerolata TaxID=455078 RepID=A0ABT8R666_9BACT|nr:hypothetical protein [Rhodocytophaga aerolata]MDO1447577.1 hypothetical protein [Rhodocytophaga aerolata]